MKMETIKLTRADARSVADLLQKLASPSPMTNNQAVDCEMFAKIIEEQLEAGRK